MNVDQLNLARHGLEDKRDASNREAQPGASAHACCPAPPQPKRRIVEFCCGPNSRIGKLAPADCEVIRLTAEDDLTTQAGLHKALTAVSNLGVPTLLFGALPCTGGSPFQRLNWKVGPETRTKIRRHWAIFPA